MRMRRVPNHLQIKVIKWFDYLWLTQKCSDEEKAVSCLPGKLIFKFFIFFFNWILPSGNKTQKEKYNAPNDIDQCHLKMRNEWNKLIFKGMKSISHFSTHVKTKQPTWKFYFLFLYICFSKYIKYSMS